MTKPHSAPTENKQGQAGFYLIFDEMAKVATLDNSLAQEIDEIAELSRMVQDVNDDDQPRFVTST